MPKIDFANYVTVRAGCRYTNGALVLNRRARQIELVLQVAKWIYSVLLFE